MSTGHIAEAGFRLGPWLVQPSLNTISRDGTSLQLEPKVMAVLVCLAEHPGEPVSKEAILQTVWPDTFVSEDVLTRSISELRRVFKDDAREPRFIQTIPKRGYRLVAPVAPVNGTSPARLREEKHFPRARTAAIAIGAVMAVLAVLGVFSVSSLRGMWRTRNTRPAIRSLAVLPLQSLSIDPSQEYFAEGMTDALITDLAQINALRVVSRTTAMRYRGTSESLPQIARELNVDAVVEGTVQRSGDRVRITAQLIYGPTDQHLWAKSFERDLKDMLVLQSAVASEIAGEIQVTVTPAEQAKLKTVRLVNPKALDAYVEARFHLDQSRKLTYYRGKQPAIDEELKNVVSYLDQAVQADPNYLPAYVAYFDAVDGDNVSQLEYLPKARAALEKALELDASNIPARLALARLLMQYDYDWRGAEREYKRAIELNPNSADAHFQFAEYLDNVQGGLDRSGDTDDARKERELAQALDPSHDYFGDMAVHRIGWTLEQERQALDAQVFNDPFALGVMGKDYAIAGRFKESVEMYERCVLLYGWSEYANLLKRADAKGGPKFALEEWMRAGEEYSRSHHDLPLLVMAFTYASLGNKDRAFAWLDKAVDQRHWMIIYLKRDDVWDPLRSDPRFNDLLRRVGLPQ